MRVWLLEKGKKSAVPVVFEAETIRYSNRRGCIVAEGRLRRYEIDMQPETAAMLMNNCVNDKEEALDLRQFGAIGFHQQMG